MDNAQDADRIEGGGRLFSDSPAKRHITKHSGSVCNGGKVTGSSKSKKVQFKKLDAVGEDNLTYRERRMGCVALDGEDGLCPGNDSSNRYKSPKIVFDDCDNVYHASVPRKLRSAVRKRSSESISPPLLFSKKLKHVADEVGLPWKDGLVNSNLKKDQADVCIQDGAVELITKDEQEVAEALYALSVMFPDAKTDKKKLVGEQPEASTSALPKAEDTISQSKEVECKTVCYKDDKYISSSNELDSATEVLLPSPNGNRQPDIPVGKQFLMESCSHSPEVNLSLTAFVSENERAIQKPCEFISSSWAELSLENGSKLLKPEESLTICDHQEVASEPTGAISSQPVVRCISEENRFTGSSLWPGLSSRKLSDPHGAKHPAWFKSSTSVEQSQISDSVIAKRKAQVVIDSKKPWKRCSTHVYISNFIKVFQVTDGRDKSLVQYSQTATNEGQKQGPHGTSNNPAWVRNELIGNISIRGTGCSLPEKDATEVRNAILLHKRLLQDQQQGPTTSGIHNAEKQSLNFLSLPNGSRVEMINSSNKPGQSPEALASLPFASVQSPYQASFPFPMSLTYYSPTSFSGYPSPAAVQQGHLSAFLGSMLPSMEASTPTSSQTEQRLQQRGAPLLIAHCRSGVTSSKVPNWQSGLPDLSPMLHNTQNLFSPSHSSGEETGSKYAPIGRQQQQQQPSVSASALLPPSTGRGQYHLPSIYEGKVGGNRPAYAENLQSAYLRC